MLQELERTFPSVGKRPRLQGDAQRPDIPSGVAPPLRDVSAQLRHVHRFGRLEIVRPVEVKKSRQRQGNGEEQAPPHPDPSGAFFQDIDPLLYSLRWFLHQFLEFLPLQFADQFPLTQASFSRSGQEGEVYAVQSTQLLHAKELQKLEPDS